MNYIYVIHWRPLHPEINGQYTWQFHSAYKTKELALKVLNKHKKHGNDWKSYDRHYILQKHLLADEPLLESA